MAAKRQRDDGAGKPASFASELNRRMVEARVGVMELAQAARLSKETITRLRDGRTGAPTSVTRRKLDEGFDLLAAQRQVPADSVVVTASLFEEFRQRVGHASRTAGANAQGIEQGHVKLDRIEQAVADVLAEVRELRGEVAALRGQVSLHGLSGPV
jgi:hypothetical protein